MGKFQERQAARQRAYDQRETRRAAEEVRSPTGSLAAKLYSPLNSKLLDNHKRQHVSPLGGVAKPEKR